MIKVQRLSRTHGGQALALALMAAALVALAAVGGYEIGTSVGQTHATQAPAVATQTGGGQEAPPINGLQP